MEPVRLGLDVGVVGRPCPGRPTTWARSVGVRGPSPGARLPSQAGQHGPEQGPGVGGDQGPDVVVHGAVEERKRPGDLGPDVGVVLVAQGLGQEEEVVGPDRWATTTAQVSPSRLKRSSSVEGVEDRPASRRWCSGG